MPARSPRPFPGEKPIAHSTVQTLLRKLEAKGAVRHEVHDRTFVFKPLIDSRSVTRLGDA